MIAHAVFYDRRDNYCVKCDHWRGACVRGHVLSSPTGCPLKKFEPVEGADYAPDMPEKPPEAVAGVGCCGSTSEETKPLTWTEVISKFGQSMVVWIKEGAPLVSSEGHATRYGTCKSCERFKNFYCLECKCLSYLKTKLATESCPKGLWK